MKHEQDLMDYRSRLLDALAGVSRRSSCTAPDLVQVLVNERRVGLLDGTGGEATLNVRIHSRIDTVQLRSEEGNLLGGLSVPEYGSRTSRIAISRHAIELHACNNAQGGAVSAVFMPDPTPWSRMWRNLLMIPKSAVRGQPTPTVPGIRAVAVTQVLLACVVVWLSVDRIMGLTMPERTSPVVTPAEAPWAAQLADVAKLERQIDVLAQMQAKAVDRIQTQQDGMAQLQQAMSKLSSAQEAVTSSVLTVKKAIDKRSKGLSHDVDRVARLLMSKAQIEQEQLEAEIHSLTVANDRLTRAMAELEQDNRDLKQRLKSAGIDVSKASTPSRDKPLLAQQIEAAQPLQVPAAEPASRQQSFMFWVTFSEGTSDESIDQWLRELHGHKGSVNEGWQEVEVVPPTIQAERFMDQIRGEKIVKAVRLSR